MRRPIEEVAASQARMIERRGASGAAADRARMTQLLQRHEKSVLKRLGAVPHVDVLIVDYPELIAQPRETADRLREFLGPDVLETPDAMPSVVKPELYRQRAEDLKSS